MPDCGLDRWEGPAQPDWVSLHAREGGVRRGLPPRGPECLPPPAGFTPGAKELFKQENHLALYRLPSAETMKESSLGRLSCVTKRRPPLSHMISLFIKDTTTSEPSPLGLQQAKPSRSLGQGSALLVPFQGLQGR